MGLMHKLTGSCRHVTELMSEGMDRELSWGERMHVRLHAMMCKSCIHFERQMVTLRSMSRAFSDHFSLGDKS